MGEVAFVLLLIFGVLVAVGLPILIIVKLVRWIFGRPKDRRPRERLEPGERPPTERQINYIDALLKERDITLETINKGQPRTLEDASNLIEMLLEYDYDDDGDIHISADEIEKLAADPGDMADYYEVNVEPDYITFLIRASDAQTAKRVAVAAYRELISSGQGVSHQDTSAEGVTKEELEYMYGDGPPDFRENEAQRLNDDHETTGPRIVISI